MSWLENKLRYRGQFSLGMHASPVEPEINLIPFIDVLLVVLIFLMIEEERHKRDNESREDRECRLL